MDAELARIWKANYNALNSLEREERRAMSNATRFRQLNSMIGLAQHLGFRPRDPWDPELQAIRERWFRLREALL